MKYYFFITVFLFGSFFVFQNARAGNGDIVINEIGAYPTSTHEWIEIWNKGAEPVDIKDWKFWENNTNHGLKNTTTSDSIISPGEFAVICQDDEVFLKDYPGFVGSVFDSSWISLNESGEEVGLKDASGNFIEQFSYVSTTKYSLERKNPFLNIYSSENWQENNIGDSVGIQNSNYFVDNIVSNTTTSGQEVSSTLEISTSSEKNIDWATIKLNEIVSDPVSGNEMVEIYNIGSSTIDLSGGSVCDSSLENCKILDGLVFGHDWLVADLLTDRYLNNSGDTIVLRDKNNNNIDQVVYGTSELGVPEKGQSIIRKQDGVDLDSNSDWAITNKITLGLANELVLPVVVNSIVGGGNQSVQNTINFVSSTSSVKNTKITATTKLATEPKDPVNISWKLDWPYGLEVGEVGIFNSLGSADPRGGNINFVWNFGDSVSSTGDYVSHTFVTSGTYLVSVIASSTAGTVGKKDFKIHVGPSFSVALSDIRIDDFQVTSTDDSLEFIYLKNYLDKPQNISGWKLKNKSGKEYELPENTIITASGTLKFFRSIHHLSFDKDGDVIRLTSPNDKEINKVILFQEKNTTKKIVKIASAKTNSSWLSVHGIVTVEPKIFGQQFFYISDGQSGFQIYQYKKDFPNLKIGDEISVSGEVSNVGGIKRIKIKNRFSIDILSVNKFIEPIDLSIEDINEELVGALVKVSGDITEIKSNLMYIDDGNTEIAVYFKKGAKINKQELKEGNKIAVVGILNRNKDGWQILPRSLEDIGVLGYADGVLDERLLIEQQKQNETTKKYVTTSISGFAALIIGFVARSRKDLLIVGVKKIANLVGKYVGRG